MDTRTKIVPSFETTGIKTLVGYFDPMHASHVRRIQELCGPGERLAVVIADPPEPILSTQARAELVAALHCVAWVVPAGPDVDKAIAGRPGVIDERSADVGRARTFSRHVVSRHNVK